MGELIRKLKQFYLRNKVSNIEYDIVKNEIYLTNRSLVLVTSAVCIGLFAILSILSFFFEGKVPFIRTEIYYIPPLISMILIFNFAYRLNKDSPKLKYVMLLVYLLIIVLFAYTIAIGVLINNNSAVIVIVLEFGAPMIFIDKIKRMFLVTFVCMTMFSILALLYKDFSIAITDVFNAICFLFLSIIPNFFILKLKVREFGLRQIIETERDTDELTGLKNKSAFIKNAKKSLSTNKNGILIILDLDFFKHINDTYGHFVGDNVLKLVSVCIQQVFRSSDFMGRFGGDEFVILMNATDNMEIARARCEKLLSLLNLTRIFANDMKNTETIHASIGYALFKNNDDFDSLFQKSDKALYNAKNTGKDKICSF